MMYFLILKSWSAKSWNFDSDIIGMEEPSCQLHLPPWGPGEKHCFLREPRGSKWEDHVWCKPHFLGELLITGMICIPLSPWDIGFFNILFINRGTILHLQIRMPNWSSFLSFCDLSKQTLFFSKATPPLGAAVFYPEFLDPNFRNK